MGRLGRVPALRRNGEVAFLIAVAFALRVFALGNREVWYDEAFSILLARRSLPEIASGTAADTMPPLYYTLLHFWMALGDDPFTLRFMGVIFSVLAVAGVYAIARRLFGSRAGLMAALLTAVAPFQVYHAQELRMYALLALALVGYVYCFVRFDAEERQGRAGWEWLALIAGFGTLALYTHNLASATLAAANVVLFAHKQWRALGKLIGAQVVSFLLFVPWLVYVPRQLEKIQHAFWTLPPGLVDVLQLLTVFTTNLPLPEWLLPVGLFAALAVFALALLELVRLLKRGAPGGLFVVGMFAVVPPAILFILSYIVRPVWVPRGVILSSLAYYVVLGWLIARTRVFVRGVLVAALLVVIAPALVYQYGYNEFPRSPFRATDQFLQSKLAAGDVIVHDNKLSFFPMHYADASLAQSFLADPANSANDTLARGSMDAMGLYPAAPDTAFGGASRVWFVIFQRAIDEAEAEGHPQGNKAWLDANWRPVSLTRFNDLDVYLYQR